jgi:hypothetical protein
MLPASPKIAEVEVALATAALDRDDARGARQHADAAAAIQAMQAELGEQYRRPLRELLARLPR